MIKPTLCQQNAGHLLWHCAWEINADSMRPNVSDKKWANIKLALAECVLFFCVHVWQTSIMFPQTWLVLSSIFIQVISSLFALCQIQKN